jgi:hypothetical protein
MDLAGQKGGVEEVTEMFDGLSRSKWDMRLRPFVPPFCFSSLSSVSFLAWFS